MFNSSIIVFMKIQYIQFSKGLFLVLAVTFFCMLYKGDLEVLNIVMLYLLPILYVAINYGQIQTFFISLIVVLVFDFLFIPPVFTFAVHDARHLLSFIIIIIVGQLISILATKAAKTKEFETSERLYEAVLNSLSHELRTPLAVIIGATSSVISNELKLTDEEKNELSQEVYNSAFGMKELIENLLTSARFESGHFKPIMRDCSIEEIISNALLRAENKYSKEAIFLVNEYSPSIMSDATLLEQAFYNLLDNAFKYGEEVTVAISYHQNNALINICNTGVLPDQNELRMIGEKFTRLSNSTNISGLGLGVFLTKRIIETLKGSIDIKISDDRFCIYIRL